MIKKEIYPKTKRVSCKGDKVYLTEKIDGSNLVFFKKYDKLYFAQRNNIICIDEIEEQKGMLYKGLYQWLLDNKDILETELHNNSAICGEWIGMGCLKYPVDEFDKRWYMFAKANIDQDYNLYNLIYDHDLFIYPFVSQEIPYGVISTNENITTQIKENETENKFNEKILQKKKKIIEGK